MQKVLQALKTNTNAVLESPTGTGKTMSLLCSALAWQASINSSKTSTDSKPHIKIESKENESNPHVQIQYESREGPSKLAPSSSKGPVFIIYASRTHAQLAQVMSELKRTSYIPRTVVLSSRDQLCINDNLRNNKNVKGSILDHACNAICAQRKCFYKNNIEATKKKTSIPVPTLMDIEEAVSFGKSNSMCSYFSMREAALSAELILMPYNYLLDASIRASLKLEWSRAIVIFDEAHNLEEVFYALISTCSIYYTVTCVLPRLHLRLLQCRLLPLT
jgi:regulator of telomere elongation helicase 1